MQMTVSEKIKAINDKIEQTKAQYNSDRQTAKISALPEKDLLENVDTMKRFEYSLLVK